MLRNPRSCWVWVAFAAFALCLPVSAASIDKYLPSDSEMVLTVNVRQVLDSPLVKKYALEQIQAMLKENAQLAAVLQALEFDPLKDVATIAVAGPSLQSADKGLVVLHGKFDTAKFSSKAEDLAKAKDDLLKIVKEGDYTLYEVHDPKMRTNKPVYVGLVDRDTIVASQAKSYIVEAFEKQAGKKEGGLKKQLQGLVEKVEGTPSVWAVVPIGAIAKVVPTQTEEAKDVLAKVDSVALEVNIADDIKMELAVAAKNANAAQDLSSKIGDGLEQGKQLVGFLLSGNKNKKELELLVDVLDLIKVGAKGTKVSIKCHMDGDFVQKAIKK